MADFTNDPRGGHAAHDYSDYAVSSPGALSRLTNLAGAAVSLALVVGVGVWGYKLLVRDVSGIPVVRAVAGEMRVRPEDPGGEFARHQGLSVNSVAAVGSTVARADALRLAPSPTDLTEDDKPMPELVETTADAPDEDLTQSEATDLAVADALNSGSVEDLVAQLTDGVAPMEALEGETTPVLASLSADKIPAAVLAGPGLRRSLRPTVRPARLQAAAARPAAVQAVAAAAEVDIASLPAGTRLVQLGAFDSPDIARAQWGTLAARFAPFMEGKSRIVQEATSGGRTFYRLRAHGFEDIGDARRFCSALVAENVDCIPVVTR